MVEEPPIEDTEMNWKKMAKITDEIIDLLYHSNLKNAEVDLVVDTVFTYNLRNKITPIIMEEVRAMLITTALSKPKEEKETVKNDAFQLYS